MYTAHGSSWSWWWWWWSQVAQSLVAASLRGTDSHGIRLLPGYLSSARSGFTNPQPQYSIVTPYPAFVVVDADQGFGLAAGCKGIDLAVELAREYGVAVVAVHNSRHAGPMAAYTTRAAAQGCVAMAMTSVPPAMRSYNGTRPFFGTNPIAVVSESLKGEAADQVDGSAPLVVRAYIVLFPMLTITSCCRADARRLHHALRVLRPFLTMGPPPPWQTENSPLLRSQGRSFQKASFTVPTAPT